MVRLFMLGSGAKRISSGAVVLGFVALVLLLRFFVLEGPSLRLSALLPPPNGELLRVRGVGGSGDEQDEAAPAPQLVAPPPELEGEAVELIQGMIERGGGVVWDHLKAAVARRDVLPEARKSLMDASIAWEQLRRWLAEEKQAAEKRNSTEVAAAGACPYSVSLPEPRDVNKGRLHLDVPCGLVLDSSLTLVAVPRGASSDFRIDLLGHALPGDGSPPLVLHYNVRLRGDALTGDPVVVQNTWTQGGDWAEEERCPPASNRTVDGLAMCSAQVGANTSASVGGSRWGSARRNGRQRWFPYAEGRPFAATLWAGWEGFHMTVDGKHITSFEYRQNLEPWMVSQVSIDGSLQLSSVIINGLPTTESLETLPDLDSLKAPPLIEGQPLDLFIGVVSTANNFERRMAVRRSWMQYEHVRSAKVAVRFFVGLHQTEQVNKELWREAESYGDLQLLPFIDYYNLITLKTLAICIYATQVAKAEYIMKTDDDTFVRVDAVLSAVNNSKHQSGDGLLYGLIESDSKPDRDVRSKWHVTPEEWPLSQYPPWAHGPGYVFTKDIAEFVVKKNLEMKLKLFKLEDVAMGAWIEDYRLQGKNVSYVNDERFHSEGCKAAYVIAHYQNPRQMVCLWHQLRQGSGPVCC